MYEHKDKIRLRKIEQADLRSLLDLKRESWWGTHKSLIVNMDDQLKWYESIPKDSLYMIAEWHLEIEKKGKFYSALGSSSYWQSIGVAVFTDIDHIARTCKISGSVFKEHRKPEIVKAGFSAGVDFAFEMLNMHRIESEVIDYNVPSQVLQIDHLGFKQEGRKRKAVYKCGHYYDSLVLGLLRDEWEKQPRVLGYGGVCNKNFNQDLFERLSERSSEKLAR
jgi:RimJ/RimL family protein N-acetyltransferase